MISYNIRVGTAKDGTNSWEYRYPVSAMMIIDQKPDIFGLQEALDFQFKYLEEYCPDYKGIGVGREDGKHKSEHMAIFYNKKTVKLIKWGTFWLSNSGNAGVFSNAEDLSVICADIMNGGCLVDKKGNSLESTRILSPATVRLMTTIMHTGYTGTSIVIDMESKTAVILLTHRVHPQDKGGVSRLRALVANIVAGSIIKNDRI